MSAIVREHDSRLLLAASWILASGWCVTNITHAAAAVAAVTDYTSASHGDDYVLGPWGNSSRRLETEGRLIARSSVAATIQPFWLAEEAKVLAADMAFGFYQQGPPDGDTTASDAVAATIDQLLRWWVPGLTGCLFRASVDPYLRTAQFAAQGIGLEDCVFPKELVAKCPWFRASPTAGFVVTPLLLAAKFPNRKWYVLGDSDTVFSPLALAQVLENFSADEAWYLGSRTENVAVRKALGWDVASGGAGVVLSGYFLEPSAALLARCFDAAPWGHAAPSGPWVLHRCLGRLGLPLTPVSGFKALDEKHPVFLRHLLEAAPVGSGLLSIRVKPQGGVFARGTRVSEPAFFASLLRDPIALGASCVCEVRAGGRAGFYTATVSAGLSVRLWPGKAAAQLWDMTRAEAVSPPPGVKAKKAVFDSAGEGLLRYAYSARQPPIVKAAAIPSVYLPDKGQGEARGSGQTKSPTTSGDDPSNGEQQMQQEQERQRTRRRLGAAQGGFPWAAVVVVEELATAKASPPLLVGAPRGFCHLATHEVVFVGGAAGDSAPVLVLRLRDCLRRPAPAAGETKEILGGLAGSVLANLIHRDGGGPANTYTGMRDRTLGAFQPAFLGLSVTESRRRRARSRRQLAEVVEASSTRGAANATHASRRTASRRLASAAALPLQCVWVAWKAKMVCEATGADGRTHTVSSTPKGLAATARGPAAVGVGSWESTGASVSTMPDSSLLASAAVAGWLGAGAWLKDEYKFAVADLAFGVVSSAATAAQRLPLLKLWWLPGAQGCLSLDRHASSVGHLLPRGLDVCEVPPHIAAKAWMRQGVKGRGLHRGAILHLVLRGRFALKKWYVVGDDDTLFNPLALAQHLRTFDAAQPWYLGGRSENLETRQRIGWDMAFGGGGVVLSGGFLTDLSEPLERCFDDAPWSAGPGGDWVLAKCVGRLGVPLTAGGGFHQFDEGSPNMIRDELERHPTAPFLSVHHESRVFKPGASPLPHKVPFFQSLWRDPIGFAQLAVCEVTGGGGENAFHWVVAVTSGLSARVVKGGSPAARELLWADSLSRSEVVQPPLLDLSKADGMRYALLLDRRTGAPFAPDFADDAVNLRVYAPDGSGERPYKLIVVAEERRAGRWAGGPRRLCHASTLEVRPSRAKTAARVLGAAAPTVLVLGLRDCRADLRRVGRTLSREALLALLAKASAPAMSAVDAAATFTELSTSFENLAKGFF